jgi:NADH-quinone oxidoreductase subunit G
MHVDQRKDQILRTMCLETEDDAKSDGWLCDRGRYNVGYLGDERRIQSPLLRDGDGYVQIAWDDAIALWAESLRKANGAAAVIGGGRLLNEEAHLLQHVYRAAGVNNVDWRAGRQRQASPGPIGGTHVELEQADVIVTAGAPPSETAPVLDLRIRKAVSRHAAMLISVGTHAARSFVDETHVAVGDLLATIPAGAKRVAFVWDGIDVALGSALADVMRQTAARGAETFAYVPGEQPNARGAEALGCVPRDGGMDTNAIFAAASAGALQSLAIVGANPLLHHPNRALVESALDAVPFLVVSELFFTETAKYADLILPACSAFEKSGTTTDLAGDVSPVAGGVRAPENVLADGDMFVLLAEALGLALPSADAMQSAIVTALAHPVASGFADATLCGSSTATAALPTVTLGEGVTNLQEGTHALRLRIDAAIFTGGGTLAHDARIAALRGVPTASMAPATAEAHGFASGDRVDVAAGEATIRNLGVVLRDDVPAHLVAVLDGIPEAPANAIADGAHVTLTRAVAARELVGGGAGE